MSDSACRNPACVDVAFGDDEFCSAKCEALCAEDDAALLEANSRLVREYECFSDLIGESVLLEAENPEAAVEEMCRYIDRHYPRILAPFVVKVIAAGERHTRVYTVRAEYTATFTPTLKTEFDF